MYAIDIKIRLIAWLVPTLRSNQVIGCEVPFFDNRRRADLVLVSPDSIEAFEIKSPRDNLDRLSGQLETYTKMFTKVTLVTTHRDLSAIRKIAPRSAGILLIQESLPPCYVRKPIARRRLKKDAAAAWLTSQHLSAFSRNDISKARGDLAKNFNQEELTRLAISAAYDKLRRRHEVFLKELGKTITEDDVKILSSPSTIRIK